MGGAVVSDIWTAVEVLRRGPHPAHYWEPAAANVPTGCVTPGRTYDGKQFVPMTLCVEHPLLGRWLNWLENYDGSWRRDMVSECFIGPNYTEQDERCGPTPLTFVKEMTNG